MSKKIAIVSAFLLMLGILAFQARFAAVEAARPVSYFLLSGKVQYIVNGKAIPATYGNVVVTATAGKSKFTTKTINDDGSYALPVQSGTYSVSASNSLKTRFNPAKYVLKVISNTTGLNFTGNL